MKTGQGVSGTLLTQGKHKTRRLTANGPTVAENVATTCLDGVAWSWWVRVGFQCFQAFATLPHSGQVSQEELLISQLHDRTPDANRRNLSSGRASS